MEPMLILLVIPSIAYLMLRADTLRTHGLDPESRESSRKMLPLISVSVVGLGGVFFWLGVRGLKDAAHPMFILSIITLARFGLGLGLFYLGWKAWQISKHDTQADLPLRQLVRRDLEATSARTAAILFILLPLALPSFVIMATFGFIPLITYGFSAYPRRYVQNQLLWTLALAAKNHQEFAREVHALANSLHQERYSKKALVFQVVGAVSCLVMPLLLLLFAPIFFRMRTRRLMTQKMFQLATTLYDGVPLEKALSQQPRLLPPEIVGAIEAASETGTLGEVLSSIALQHSRQLEHRNSAGQNHEVIVAHAAIIGLVTLNVIAFVMYWIIPKFKMIFNDFGVELPKLTLVWIWIADIFVNYWYLLGPLLCLPLLPFLLAYLLLLDDSTWVPRWILRVFPRIETPTLLNRLSYVAANNLHLEPSLRSLANATTDLTQARRFERLENRLQLGDALGISLNEEGFVNVREAHSIDYSAKIGHLSWALSSIANSIRQRRLDRSRWAMEFARPVMMISIALIVASFCLAMFLPLIKLLGELL